MMIAWMYAKRLDVYKNHSTNMREHGCEDKHQIFNRGKTTTFFRIGGQPHFFRIGDNLHFCNMEDDLNLF